MIAANELEHVNLSALRQRLFDSGWKQQKRENLLQAPDGTFYVLPKQLKSELDYVALRLVVEAVLSTGQSQTLLELQHRIEGRKEDLIFLGCEIVDFAPGKLPATHAPAFYEKSNRFLRTSAASLQADRSFTGKRGIYERITYGETKESSYLVAAHVPVDTIADPIGRAFVRKAVAAVESLHKAVEREDDGLLRNDADARWTADMCEAILGFVEDKLFSEFKFQAAPDPIWVDTFPMNTDQIVVPLKTGVAETVLSSAAASLRHLRPSERVEVVGVPFESKDFSVIGEGDERTVGILWKRENAPDLRVHASMSQSAYEKMLDSQSKRMVRVEGWLRQKGSRWVLEVDGEPTLLDLMDVRPGDRSFFAEAIGIIEADYEVIEDRYPDRG